MDDPIPQKRSSRQAGGRVLAVDALRGLALVVFFVAEAFVPVLREVPASPIRDFFITHLTHSPWHGCTFFDLGFPAFVMLLAMSVPLAFERRQIRGASRGELLRRVLVRSLLLYAFGTVFHGGFSVPWEEVRLTRVFHRLAIAVLFSGLAELMLRPPGKWGFLAAVLGGYWALMEFVPVPGFGTGDYSEEGNLNRYIDRTLLGAKTYFHLSTLGVFGTCLFGLLGGELLVKEQTWRQRAAAYVFGGVVLINLGMLWNFWCPINKPIWTPSFVLFSSGWVFLIFGVMYVVADGLGWSGWAAPLMVLGRHPFFTYAAFGLLPFARSADLLMGEGAVPLLGAAQPFVKASVHVLLPWLLVYWLDRRNAILRI